MQLELSREADTALYIQIYEQLKHKIMQHELQKDERLPSKRQLALNNGVSQNTIINAYEQLLIEGYIYAEERRGYFVSDVQYHEPVIEEIVKEMKAEENYVDYNLTASWTDATLFPFATFQRIYKELLQDETVNLLQPAPVFGLPALREAIANYLSESRGVPAKAEQVLLGPSTHYLLQWILPLMSPLKRIGIEDPGYRGFQSLFSRFSKEIIPIPVDNQGIEVDSLNTTDVQLTLITPNHQYPTGSIMPIERRQALLNWLEQDNQRYIIEDDYDSEFKYSGLPVPPLIQLDQSQRVFYMGSFSRSLTSSTRVAYLVLPEAFIEAHKEELNEQAATLNVLNQWALARFIQDGHFSRHLNRSRSLYKKKRDQLIKAIHLIDPQVKIFGEEAGLSLLVQPSKAFDAEILKRVAYADKVKLSVLSDFAIEETNKKDQIIFISFSSLPSEKIDEFVEKLGRWLSEAGLK